MKIFGWKSAGRAVARPVLSRGWSTWINGAWPRSYEDRVRAGYLDNPVAQRAVRMVAEGVASAPLSASAPEIMKLVTARTSGQALLETVATQLLLHGNAYVQVLTGPPPLGAAESPLPQAGGERPVELFALRPERVTVEAAGAGRRADRGY
jgi:phage portal protein BeeE